MMRDMHTAVRGAAAIAAALVVYGSTVHAQAPRRPVLTRGVLTAPAVGEPGDVVVQPRDLGAVALGSALQSLGTTARVLMIAAHPDDEDTPIISWLARGRQVETAYLSLTRGDGGQNLIGNELGDQLGVIRTEELLAARRIDGGRQFFTRAFDFGFSKNEVETFEAWPRDSILGDVVRVVRAFRPHVIVSVFSGTPRDGHGHHRVAGLLARAVYDQAADTAAFPVLSHGLPWTVQKFYRSSRFAPDEMTLRVNVGEYSPMFGRSYSEIASESRSQHKSQGFGSLQRRGAQWGYLRREATRAPAPEDARTEGSIFDGIDTTWSAVTRRSTNVRVQAFLDSADAAFVEARNRYRVDGPDAIVAPLARAVQYVRSARDLLGARPPVRHAAMPGFSGSLVNAAGLNISDLRELPPHADPALWDAVTLTEQRASLALTLAAGVAVEATAARRLLPMFELRKGAAPDTMDVAITVYNRGRQSLVLHGTGINNPNTVAASTLVAPDSAVTTRLSARANLITAPWWRTNGRESAYFRASIDARDDAERQRQSELAAVASVTIAGVPVYVRVPVVNRFADPVKGDQQIPVAVVPGITIGLDRGVEYARAGVPIVRRLRVNLLSAYPSPQTVSVELKLPPGLEADSMSRERTLLPDVGLSITFNLRGTLPEGMHQLQAIAVHMGQPAMAGYYTIAYDHITPQRNYTASAMYLSAVPVTLRAGTRVGYIAGVSDDGISALRALDIPTEELEPARIASTDLSQFSAIVIGPRAYQVSDALRAANPRLFAWAQAGGTLVVQYGQNEMQEPGVMPYPVQLARPAARVTNENATVRVLDANAPLLRIPNRIGEADWNAWMQERALYMPSSFDPRYRTYLGMNDPDEAENRAAILSTPLGRGLYVYTSLALFRQLPFGVPGGARLLVNLVSAKGSDTTSP